MKQPRIFKLLSSVAITLTITLALAGSVSAQQATETSEQGSGGVVATVNIYDAKIVSQSGNVFTLAFDLFNEKGIQPGIKYGVSLIGVDKDSIQIALDKKVYSETVTLKAKETKHIEVIYTAPQELSGTYMLLIEASTLDSLPLGIAVVGDVTLQKSGTSVVIDTLQCVLIVKEDKEPILYNLSQGVDVTTEEHLLVYCPLISGFAEQIQATPVFTTYYRNVFGAQVGEEVKKAPITISAKEAIVGEFEIPKGNNPQAYDVVLRLVDNQGNDISNKVIIHYVLAGGQSAAIQNVIFDKDSYAKGDTANVTYVITGPATAFPGARTPWVGDEGMTITMRLVSGNGKQCATPFEQKDLSKTVATIPVTADCVQPKLDVIITNKDGGVVASKQFMAKENQTTGISKTQWAIGSIVVLFVIYGLIMLRKKNILVLSIALLCYGIIGGIVGANTAKADTFTFFPPAPLGNLGSSNISGQTGSALTGVSSPIVTGTGNTQAGDRHQFTTTFSASLNKAQYCTGETATVSGSVSMSTCSNGGAQGAGPLTATINNSTKTIVSRTGSGSGTFTVQSTPGMYTASFSGTAPYGSGRTWTSAYTVVRCGGSQATPSTQSAPSVSTPNATGVPQNWQSTQSMGGVFCGPSNDKYFDEYGDIPNNTKCLNGTPSTIPTTLANIWFWSCRDTYGNISNTCAAFKTPTRRGVCGYVPLNSYTKPTTNLCSYGTASVISDNNGVWAWTCNGTGGGGNVTCTVEQTIDGRCGRFTNGRTFAMGVDGPLCDVGYAREVRESEDWWGWTCYGSGNGQNAGCSAQKVVAPRIESGRCGSAATTPTAVKPTTNLCSYGTASPVSGSGPWSWRCDPIGDAFGDTCTAQKIQPIPGVCGVATTPTAVKPTTNLCSYGTASPVSGSGPWSWLCGDTLCIAPIGSTSTPMHIIEVP